MTTEDATNATLEGFGSDKRAFIESVMHRPLLVSAEHVNLFLAGLMPLPFEALADASMQDNDGYWSQGWMSYYRPYNVQDGVLRIPVYGSLVNKLSMQFGQRATGYEYIRRAFVRGLADKSVKGIMFDINSPGGESAGNFELAGEIASARGKKPILAVANDMALSGGFSIASAADEVVATPSGLTGSVGVIMVHAEITKLLSNWGINVNIIRAGEFKARGNMLESLDKDTRERFQTGVNKIYDVFVDVVARNRNMSHTDVRDTEALVYDAKDSVELGFADRIGELRQEAARFASQQEGSQMSTETGTEAGSGTEVAQVQAVDTAKVAADAKVEERKRFAAVHAADEYKGREKLAAKLLGETDMSSESIIGILGTAEVAAAPAPAPAPVPSTQNRRDHFREAMDQGGTPGVGAEDRSEEVAEDPRWPGKSVGAIAILADHVKSGGSAKQQQQVA